MDLEELEMFAKTFKRRRIELGKTILAILSEAKGNLLAKVKPCLRLYRLTV